MDKVWAECARRMFEAGVTPSLRATYETLFAMREELRSNGNTTNPPDHKMWMLLNILVPQVDDLLHKEDGGNR